jgi:hypothetical protein
VGKSKREKCCGEGKHIMHFGLFFGVVCEIIKIKNERGWLDLHGGRKRKGDIGSKIIMKALSQISLAYIKFCLQNNDFSNILITDFYEYQHVCFSFTLHAFSMWTAVEF